VTPSLLHTEANRTLLHSSLIDYLIEDKKGQEETRRDKKRQEGLLLDSPDMWCRHYMSASMAHVHSIQT